MSEEFPSNSQSPKKAPKEREKLEPVVTGEVTMRKKPLGKRIKEAFIGGDDARSVIGYVWSDVMLPAAKDMFVDSIQQGAERAIYGESRGGRRRGTSSAFGNAMNQAYTSYRSAGSNARQSQPTRRDVSDRSRQTHNFGEIEFDTRADAVDVLDNMFAIVSQFEQVTVMDLYDLAGYTSKFTDENYGWTDIRGSQVRRTRGGGYVIDLPPPIALNR